MSNAVSALPDMAADGIVQVAEAGLVGMVTLKANLSSQVAETVKTVTGQDMPRMRGIAQGEMSVAWMAPDELLILCSHGQADQVVKSLSRMLTNIHHLVVNMSDARAVFTLRGVQVKDVLGKLSPADLSTFASGEMRRSRIAQIPAAFWMSGPDEITLICFRSVAQYAFDVLKTAAKDGGEVGYHC